MSLTQTFSRYLPLLAGALVVATASASATTPPQPSPPRFPLEGVLSDARGNLLVASAFDGLYRRSPADARWQKSLDLPARTPVRLFDGGDAGWFVEIGTDWPRVEANLRAFRSTDAGAHWQAVPPKAWIGAGHGHVFACDDQVLLDSLDRGSSWHVAGRPPQGCRDVLVASATLLYATTGHGDMARSEDGGAHWNRSHLPLGMPGLRLGPGGTLYAQGTVPETRPQDLADGFFRAVSRSDDHGDTWQREWFGERDETRAISLVAVTDRFVIAHEAVMPHRPFRILVRDGKNAGQWTETDYVGASIALPAHADAVSYLDHDGIYTATVTPLGIVTRQGPDRAGLPDEDTGDPRLR